MSVLYNLEIFSALKIAFGDKADGFSEEDFEINERERGLYIPGILRRFLERYGYMPLNRLSDSVKFLHPNLMTERFFHYGEDGELPLTIVGRVGEFQVAIADKRSPDPEIYLIKQTPEEVQILPSDDTISEIMKVMLCGVLLKNEHARIVDSPRLAVKLLKENGVDFERISNKPELRREYTLCFSEETRTFTVAEFVDGEVIRFFFIRDENFVYE